MNEMIGRYCVIRANSAGVFAGTLKAKNGTEVTLTNARRLWYWEGANECLEISKSGVEYPDRCKFTVTVDEICVLDVMEILPCSPTAEEIIKAVPEWTA